MTDVKKKPSIAEQELNKLDQQFQEFDQNVKELTLDRMNAAPKREEEQQTKLSQKDIEKSKDVYLKPDRSIPVRDKFNEDYRKQYEFDKEYVHFVAENKEIIGEMIEIWTRPYGGMPAEFWKVPTNKPVWGPRYLAEQIKSKCYHRMVMQQNTVGADHAGQYYGTMAADTTIQRLDAHPVSSKKSLFMGASGF
jgi:hypothetical protein